MTYTPVGSTGREDSERPTGLHRHGTPDRHRRAYPRHGPYPPPARLSRSRAFILNGLGYLTLLAALYLPVPQVARYRKTARWALIGYTALTISLWILLGARTPIGYIDKIIEISLILLLLVEARRSD